MATISLTDIGKVYADGTRAVNKLNLEIGHGEFMIFVGPSGCGKTTVLRMIAGLEPISEGQLRIDEAVVNDIDPGKRDIAMVFQNYALYPHMSVFDNIAFPLRSRHLRREDIRTQVEQTAEILGLAEHLRRKPRNLSGGQRQRVAMGRAIVRKPRAFLMDEPLSNLDAKLRVQMRNEISRIQRELGITTVYVTHDQVEAMTMGTRIAVMSKGVLQQQGPPDVVYETPANLFVATFIGSPAMNLVQGKIISSGSEYAVRIGTDDIPLPGAVIAARPALTGYVDRKVAVGIRPEHFSVSAPESLPRLKAVVTHSEMLGHERLLYFTIPGTPVVTDQTVDAAEKAADEPAVMLGGGQQAGEVPMVARVDPVYGPAASSRVELGVDPARLHFFDLESELSIQADGSARTASSVAEGIHG
jgi:multiple sugar transport system ATP-binding protein